MPTIYISNKDALPDRDPYDFYQTEPGIIQIALNRASLYCSPYNILDIGAGDGRWGQIASVYFPYTYIVGVELRDAQPSVPSVFNKWFSNTDFLTWQTDDRFNLILSNPPFKYAEEFVRTAWKLLNPKGCMAMLLPIEFQCSITRYFGLWEELPPKHVVLLSRRPSFYNGKTGGSEFGIYFWCKKENGTVDGNPVSWHTSLAVHERGKYEYNST